MTALPIALVIGSGLIHAVWNLFAKQSVNKSAFLWYCQLLAVFIYLPWAIIALRQTSIAPVGYFWLTAATTLHGVYVVLLAKTYTAGDLSQVYPLMRGTSPLLVPIIGTLILGESLALVGWFGVAFIIMGMVLISGWVPLTKKGIHVAECTQTVPTPSGRAAWLALCVGISIASYTALDKVALRFVPPVALNNAGNAVNLVALTWVAFHSRALRNEWKLNWRTILLGGILAPGGYLLFLAALDILPTVARLAPMREIGTVFAAILGAFVLKESQGKRRIMASLLIATGVLLLGIA